MVQISTPEELQNALEAHETEIVIKGDMVKVFRNHKTARTVLIISSIVLLLFGVFGSPLTDGYSMIAGAAGILLCIGTFAFKGLPIAVPFALRTAGARNAFTLLKSGKAWIDRENDAVCVVVKYKD